MDKTNKTPRTESETSKACISIWPLNPAACLALTHPTTAVFYNKLLSNCVTGAASHQMQGSMMSAPSQVSNCNGPADMKAAFLSGTWRCCRLLRSLFPALIFITGAYSNSTPALIFLTYCFRLPSLTYLSFLAVALISGYISGISVYTHPGKLASNPAVVACLLTLPHQQVGWEWARSWDRT